MMFFEFFFFWIILFIIYLPLLPSILVYFFIITNLSFYFYFLLEITVLRLAYISALSLLTMSAGIICIFSAVYSLAVPLMGGYWE